MKMKRFVLLVVLVFACNFMIGCVGNYREKEQENDPTKTQLYVQNFIGGYGSEWLHATASRFEEFYKDSSFEEGKLGVQVKFNPAKTDGITLMSKLDATSSEVFFNESVYYYDYLAKSLLLDITDVVTQPLTEYGEEKSILQKMSAEQISYYSSDSKYYGVPHYAGYNGIIIDKDLFDLNGLYFKNVDGSVFVQGSSDIKSAGPDGALGTTDDGFPATYDEFYKLCDYMASIGITPFIWTGQYYDTYIEKVMYAMSVDHDGLNQTMLNYTFDGTATNLISAVDANGNYTKQSNLDISAKNGYNLWRSEGKYLAMKFFEKIIKNSDYYARNVFSPSHLYTEAQKDYIESRPEDNSIAMILEGCWFENEVKDVIKQTGERYGEEFSSANRNFAMMPLPKATSEKVGAKSTIVDTHYSLGFIKKSIASSKIDLAKKFLRFCNTDQSLVEFSVKTNTVKALNYEIDDSNLSKMTTFGKSVYSLHNNSDIVYPYSAKSIYLDNQSKLSVHNSYNSLINKIEKARPITYLKDNVSNKANEYFNGMYDYQMSKWENTYGGYYK